MQRIFIVEDDATIARLIARELESWGYEILLATDFARVMEDFASFQPHLVLLDLSLPHRSGFHWCGEIRRESSVPVVFLSSAADNMNQVRALQMGGDDFIAKPFDLPVLVAKVQAMLRRSYDFARQEEPEPSHRGAVLRLGERNLQFAGKTIELTRNEFGILRQLMTAIGSVVTREEIMRALWDDESFIDDNTLTVNIARLRRKLEDAGLPDFIATKKGVGYLLPGGEEE